MDQNSGNREKTDLEELLVANMIEIQTLTQLLMDKGIIDKSEYYNSLKQVQADFEKYRSA